MCIHMYDVHTYLYDYVCTCTYVDAYKHDMYVDAYIRDMYVDAYIQYKICTVLFTKNWTTNGSQLVYVR